MSEIPLTIRRSVHGVPTVFVWHGGQYVDVRPLGQAVDVINVWHGDTDEPDGPRTLAYLRREVNQYVRRMPAREWLDEYCYAITRNAQWRTPPTTQGDQQ